MSTTTGGDLNLVKPELTDDHKVTIGTDLPANFQKIDDEFSAHLADTAPHPDEILPTYIKADEGLNQVSTPARDTWYQISGFSITVPAGTYRVDFKANMYMGLTSIGQVLGIVQLGISATPGVSLLGVAAAAGLCIYNDTNYVHNSVFLSQVFTFASETSLYLNYQVKTASGTPTLDPLYLRNDVTNAYIRATKIKKVS